jgi:MFS transporter, DHA1 family, tetracycline resistance protein
MIKTSISNFLASAKTLRGNARVLFLTNIFCWPVQYAFVSQYLPLYLTSADIGLSKEQYGILCSITACTVMIGGFVSGSLAARLNPKIVNACGDILSFSIASILWAVSTVHEPVLLAVAAIVSGAWGWHNASFQLLLTYRQNKETLPSLFAFFSIAIMGMGLLTPLAGLLLRHFDLISLMRVMLMANATLVAIGVVFRLRYVERFSSEQPAERRGIGELLMVFKVLKNENRALRVLFTLVFINGICGVARFNYGAIYYTDALGVSKAAISILPAVSSIVLILVTLLAAPHFKSSAATKLFRFAFLLLTLADTATALAPRSVLAWLVGIVILTGLGGFLIQSLMTATVMNLSKKESWPYLVGLNVPIFSLSGIVAAPLMGKLYEVWPRAPFAVSAVLSAICLVVALRSQFKPIHEPVPAPANVERM